MKDLGLVDITVESTRAVYKGGTFIDNDFGLIDDVSVLTFPTEARRMKCLVLALCTRGSADYQLSTVEHHTEAGDIIIINTGQVIDEFSKSDDFEAIALEIDDPFFYEIISGIHDLSYLFTFSRMHPVFHLNHEEMQSTLNYLTFIKDKMEQKHHRFRRDIIRSLIQALIYDTCETIARLQDEEPEHNTRAESIFVEFMRLVEEKFREERRVGWYAETLNITPKYLSETIKSVSRRTPNDWIDDFVVLELRVMLRNTTMSIKEITEAMHFPNQSFLGKYFKEHVGMSPSEYRKN